MDLLNKVSEAVDDVSNAVEAGVLSAAFKIAEQYVKEHTGREIKVSGGHIPEGEWTEWMRKTGVNSLCVDTTWAFLEKGPGCDRRLELWEKLDVKEIELGVFQGEMDEYEERWWVCNADAKDGKMTLQFYPRALRWASSSMWNEPGSKCWWILNDTIVFGLELYEIEGRCFYKSGWVDDFEDIDPNSCLPNGTTKYKRWLQFRHWTMMWYEKAMPGWNYQWTKKPPPSPDGLDFSLDSILDLPDMPSMPSISLPTLPDIEMPDMPSVDLPSIDPSMPSIDPSMPSFDPSMSMPSMEERKVRPKSRWACHGIIELGGLKVKASGSSLILSDATVHQFWEKDNHIDSEKEEHKRFELKVTSAEQASSWVDSLKESGAEEGDVGGCCTIA